LRCLRCSASYIIFVSHTASNLPFSCHPRSSIWKAANSVRSLLLGKNVMWQTFFFSFQWDKRAGFNFDRRIIPMLHGRHRHKGDPARIEHPPYLCNGLAYLSQYGMVDHLVEISPSKLCAAKGIARVSPPTKPACRFSSLSHSPVRRSPLGELSRPVDFEVFLG